MGNRMKEYNNIKFTNSTLEQKKDTKKMVMDLMEMFFTVSEKIVKTIVLASDGNKILAYNALLFYTEEYDTYLNERLPVAVVVEPSKYQTSEIDEMEIELRTPSPVQFLTSNTTSSTKEKFLEVSISKETSSCVSNTLSKSLPQQNLAPILSSARKQEKAKSPPKNVKFNLPSQNTIKQIDSECKETKKEDIKEVKQEVSYDPNIKEDQNVVLSKTEDGSDKPGFVESVESNWDEVTSYEDKLDWAEQEFPEEKSKKSDGWTKTQNKKRKSPKKKTESKPQSPSPTIKNQVVIEPGVNTIELDSLLSKSAGGSPFRK